MTEEWVSYWYQCLSQNMDYSFYCNAREGGDNATRKALESRFPKVAEIYQDFGCLDGWPDEGRDSHQWKDWFAERRHLFIPAVREVGQGKATVAPAPGHVRLDVPLLASHSEVSRLVEDYLTIHYPLGTYSVQPKYQLFQVDGRPAHGEQQVRQACLSAARSYAYHPDTFEERKYLEAVTEFVRNEIDELGWSIDPRARQALMESGELSIERMDSFKARLNKCRRDFKAFAANTIRSRFPDDSPFDSEVLDRF